MCESSEYGYASMVAGQGVGQWKSCQEVIVGEFGGRK